MRGRVARGILANGYGQAVTIGSQIVSVPLLIHAWGATGFGLWVMLTAVPTALAFVDGGLVVAGGNAMAAAIARGDHGHAAALHRAIQGVLARAVLGGAVVVAVAVAAIPTRFFAWAEPIDPCTLRQILLLMTGVVLAGTVSTLPAAALRAGGLYARSVVASTTIRFAEVLAIMGVAAAGWHLVGAAATWFAVRAAGAGWLVYASGRHLPWLTACAQAPLSLRALRGPALASIAMPAGFAVGLQGLALAVGLAVAPDAVALFAATRTLARASVQLSGLVNHALMPEMACMVGRQDHGGVRSLVRMNALSCAGLLALGWLATVLAGPAILSAWTGGRLQPDPRLLTLLASAAALHGLWLGQANMLLAVNRQAEFAWFFLPTSLAVVLLAWPVARRFGLDGVAALTLAGEFAMAVRLWLPRSRPTAPVAFVVGGRPS